MSKWDQVSAEVPELAQRVYDRFEAHPHHVLATLRRDGSPRVSGINVFFNSGELWFGSMPGARKIDDLVRDPRLSLHSAPLSEELIGGDARVSGLARLLPPHESSQWLQATQGNGQPGVVALVDVLELSLVEVEGDEMVITSWSVTSGLRVTRRK